MAETPPEDEVVQSEESFWTFQMIGSAAMTILGFFAIDLGFGWLMIIGGTAWFIFEYLKLREIRSGKPKD